MAGFALVAVSTIVGIATFRERAALRLDRLLTHVAREPAVRAIVVLHPDGSVRARPPGASVVPVDCQMVARALQPQGGTVVADIRNRTLRFLVRVPSLKDHAQSQALLFLELDITRPLAALGHQMWASALYASSDPPCRPGCAPRRWRSHGAQRAHRGAGGQSRSPSPRHGFRHYGRTHAGE